MDLDDELYGTSRAKSGLNIKGAGKLAGDGLDYGMELDDGEESSEDDNYYYGVSLNRGQPHKQMKSVD